MSTFTEQALFSIVTEHLNEGGNLLASLFEEDGMNEAAGMSLVAWFGQFQRAVEKVSPFLATTERRKRHKPPHVSRSATNLYQPKGDER